MNYISYKQWEAIKQDRTLRSEEELGIVLLALALLALIVIIF